MGDGIILVRFCCVNLSSSDMTDLPNSTQFVNQVLLAQFKNGKESCRSLVFIWSSFGTNFRNFSLVVSFDLFRKFLSWERLDRSSPHFSHQFENDALWLLPTLGQSGEIEISHNYGSVSPLTIFDLIISNAVFLPDSQSIDRTKTTMRLQMSPLSRQWPQHLKDGMWLIWPFPWHCSQTSFFLKENVSKAFTSDVFQF